MRMVHGVSDVHSGSSFLGGQEHTKVDAFPVRVDFRAPSSALFVPVDADEPGRVVPSLSDVHDVAAVRDSLHVAGQAIEFVTVDVVDFQSGWDSADMVSEDNLVQVNRAFAFAGVVPTRVAVPIEIPRVPKQPPPKGIVRDGRPSAQNSAVAASTSDRNPQDRAVNKLAGSHRRVPFFGRNIGGQSRQGVSAPRRLALFYEPTHDLVAA